MIFIHHIIVAKEAKKNYNIHVFVYCYKLSAIFGELIMGNEKGVRRIKRLLLAGPYIAVLIPIVLCILLFLIICRQSDRIDELNSSLAGYEESQNKAVENIEQTTNDDIDSIVTSLSGLKADVESIKKFHETERDPNEWPKKVYLTFDDGPSANTEKILEILKEYNVKATFFVVGTKSENLKKMYKRIVDDGHAIGMHSYSHKYSEVYSSKDAFVNDLEKITSLIYDETGVWSKLYRFPGGSSNDVSKVPMQDLVDILDSRGIEYFDWNVLSGDATNPIPTTEEIVSNVMNHVGDNEESIILFHDLANKTTTVEALPQIIEALLEQGITIAPIDDTTMLIQHMGQHNK